MNRCTQRARHPRGDGGLRRLDGLLTVLVALFVAPAAAADFSAAGLYRGLDPFGTDSRVAPAPHQRWEPDQPLPPVPAPSGAEVVPPAGQVLALPELTDLALRNNPRTRQSWYAARAAAAGVGIEQARYLPLINGTYNWNRNQTIAAATGTEIPLQTRFGPGVTLSYILFDFGARASSLEAANLRLLAANLTQNRTLQDVVFQIETAYYQVLGFDALVRANQLSLKNVKTSLEAAQRRREAGFATIADVYRAETQVALAERNLASSVGGLEKAKGQLATAAGVPVGAALRVQGLQGPPQIREMTEPVATMLERAKANRPDLIAAQSQVLAARASAEATARSTLPSIEIAGNANRTMFGDNRPSADAYGLAFNVRIPLFSGFRDTYAVRQAEAQRAQAEATRDQLFQQAQLEVWQSYYDLQTSASTISSTEVQVKSAEQAANVALARYESGFGSIVDLVTAQTDESTARVQRVQAYFDWFVAFARLSYSIGMNDIFSAAGTRP